MLQLIALAMNGVCWKVTLIMVTLNPPQLQPIRIGCRYLGRATYGGGDKKERLSEVS